MISYPIILFPDLISKDVNTESFVDEVTGTIPEEPRKPTKQKTHEGCMIGFIFFAITAVVASGAIPLGTSLPFGLVLTVVLWVVFSSMGQSEYNKNMRQYEKDYKMYQLKMVDYKNAIQEAKNCVNELISNGDKNWRFQLIQEKLKKQSFKLSTGFGKKGVSEDYFVEYIKTFFKCNIFQNSPVKCNNVGSTYYPDLIMYFSDANLAIAIEIDEPYKIKDGEPIHYYRNEEGIPLFVDDELFTSNVDSLFTSRSNEITKEGFIVIRFAEKQIVDQPEACCKYIYDKILRNTGLSLTEKDFSSFNELNKINAWTKEEAKEMRRIRFRESYLNKIGSQDSFQENDDLPF